MNLSLVALLLMSLVLLLIALLVVRRSKPRLNKKYYIKHWQSIETEKNPISQLVKADALLDEAMQHTKISGETTGERLNNATVFIKDIQGTWSAHKLRNKIVHEAGFQPSARAHKAAFAHYKKALKDLGAL